MNEAETTSYSLGVFPGSGWNDANWLIIMMIPAHGIWPSGSAVLRSFKTEEEAREEAVKMVVDIVRSSSERR